MRTGDAVTTLVADLVTGQRIRIPGRQHDGVFLRSRPTGTGGDAVYVTFRRDGLGTAEGSVVLTCDDLVEVLG